MAQSQAMGVLTSSKEDNWYTPSKYIEAARRSMGGIELDPASSAIANELVKAERFFAEEDDGLNRPWIANSVWLNPPYGKNKANKNKSNQGLWTDKLIAEYKAGNVKQAILLVNNYHGYQWHQPLWEFMRCEMPDLIEFLRPDGTTNGPAKASSVFIYLGPYESNFESEFSDFGYVGKLRRDRKPVCPVCNNSFDQKSWGGSDRVYCSPGCRQKAYRLRSTSSITRV